MAAALRLHAEGLCSLLAAVELLIGHRSWLCRDDFVARFVKLAPGAGGCAAPAKIRWRSTVHALGAGSLPCSASEGCVLRIAASIAEGVPVDLSECLSTLDDTNVGLVGDAVLRARGRTVPGGGAGRGGRR